MENFKRVILILLLFTSLKSISYAGIIPPIPNTPISVISDSNIKLNFSKAYLEEEFRNYFSRHVPLANPMEQNYFICKSIHINAGQSAPMENKYILKLSDVYIIHNKLGEVNVKFFDINVWPKVRIEGGDIFLDFWGYPGWVVVDGVSIQLAVIVLHAQFSKEPLISINISEKVPKSYTFTVFEERKEIIANIKDISFHIDKNTEDFIATVKVKLGGLK